MLDTLFEGIISCAWRAAQLSQSACVGVFGSPFLDTMLAHEIAVVFHQFFLARAGHPSQKNLRFLGSPACLTAFENVLFARPGSLHHLVMSAGFFVNEPVAEIDSSLIDNQGFVVGEQLFVA